MVEEFNIDMGLSGDLQWTRREISLVRLRVIGKAHSKNSSPHDPDLIQRLVHL